MNFLFVYGTLRKRFNNPMSKYLNENAHYLGEGFIQGQLYHISWYPGFVESQNILDKVVGDIYKIDSSNDKTLFNQLDEYEGDAYFKKTLKVSFGEKEIQATVYIFKGDISNKKRILSGDYTATNE